MKILVSGASIAGPAVAYWLAEQGFEVVVVERAPAPRPGGYAVDIRGVALEVVERMGLRDRLRPFETDTLSNEVVDASGRRFGRTARGFGVIDPGDVEILRGDLVRVLHEVTAKRATYRFGTRIVSLEEREAHVDVTFSSGAAERFDVVLGADGIHSGTRALVFGPEHSYTRDLGSCMSAFTVPNVLGLQREQLLFSALGRVASVKSANEDRELKVSLFFEATREQFDERDLDAQKRLTAEAYRGAGWELPRLVEAMWSADDFYCDVTSQIRMERFTHGRVALLGDAAYGPSPLSGQGTSLALVGAYVLAAELAEARDPLVALPRYEAAIRDFVVRNQDVALEIAGGFAPSTPFQLWMRNAFMRVLPYVPGTGRMMQYAMRHVRDASRALTLPPIGPRSASSSATASREASSRALA